MKRNSPSTSQNKENIPRGCLTFQDKIYPVYVGHNTIGRNPRAVVNIKNINISQLQAVITIVDDNTHFISDFKSSNGTTVNNRRLNPLKLYPLDNGASIKFADSFCTYKKFTCKESLLDTSATESQDFSQSFYAASTQTIQLHQSDEIPFNEMATQIMDEMPTRLVNSLNTHEMETHENASLPLNINEMQIQTVNFNDYLNNEDSTDSIDFMTMQKSSENQGSAFEKQKDVKSDTDEPCTAAPHSLESEVVLGKINASKKRLSENEQPIPELKLFTIKSPNKAESDEETPASQVFPVKMSTKNIIESDSDEDMPLTSTRHKSRYIISDDDETDIEDDVKGEPQNKKLSEEAKNCEEKSINKETTDVINEEAKENLGEKSNTSKYLISEDHLYCLSLNKSHNTQNEALSSSTIKNDNIVVEIVPSKSTENEIEEIGDSDQVNLTQSKSENTISNQIGDGFNGKTQKLIEVTPEDKKEEESNNNEPTQPTAFDKDDTKLKSSKNEEDKVIDGTFAEPTQSFNPNVEKDRELDDIYLQPTQELSTSAVDHPSNYSLVDDDDIYMKPTQELNNLNLNLPIVDTLKKIPIAKVDEKIDKNSSFDDHDFLPPLLPIQPSTSKSAQPADEIDDDELFLPPTQALEILHKGDDEADIPSKVLSDKKEVEDELEMLFASQSDHRFVATQQLVDVLEKNDIIDDSLIEGPSFNKWKKTEFNSVEAIKKILDSSISSNDDSNKEEEVQIKEKDKEKAQDAEKENLDVKSDKDNENITGKGRKRANISTNVSNKIKSLDVQSNQESQSSVSSSSSSINTKSLVKKNKIKNEQNVKEANEVEPRQNRISTRNTKENTNNASEEKAVETRKTKRNLNKEDNSEVTKIEIKERKSNKNLNEKNTRTRSSTSQTKEKVKEETGSKKTQITRTTRSTRTQPEEEQEEKTSIKEMNKRKRNSDMEKFAEKQTETGDSEYSEGGKRRKKCPTTPEKSTDDETSGRKRATSSEDEFMFKIQKPGTSKKGRTTKNNTDDTPAIETPNTRRSTRSKKIDLDQKDSPVPTSSSSVEEVISIPSSSSTPVVQPTKRGRKLSANSRALKNEEKTKKVDKQLSPIVGTLERSKRPLKPKVVFTMMDSPALESVIRQLGGSVVDTVDACTVLVTEQVKRSLKLLRAVGQGKPICSPKWLNCSKESYKFLDPWNFILVDKEAEKKWDFSLRESLERSANSKLLENYTFQIMATTATDVLKGAIESCGGKCVTRNLSKAGSDNLIIIATAEQKNKFNKIIKEHPNIKVVEPEAIFDGTLRQEFHFERHMLP